MIKGAAGVRTHPEQCSRRDWMQPPEPAAGRIRAEFVPGADGSLPGASRPVSRERRQSCDDLVRRAVAIDLETDRSSGVIRSFAAVRADTGRSFCFRKGGLETALSQLDKFAAGAGYLLGHNIISHDIPHLVAAKPDLTLLNLPVLDTLRLSPLAFPRNPYHRLVKHYKDGQLAQFGSSDPKLDAELALQVFKEQCGELLEGDADLLCGWHWLASRDPERAGSMADKLFASVRGASRPTLAEARSAIGRRMDRKTCVERHAAALDGLGRRNWPFAYSLAWLSVAGGNSVIPPWVMNKFPEAGKIVRGLRDSACKRPDCKWCRERHDATRELRHWFGYSGFRPEPADARGRSMQKAIVESALSGKHLLGILPTGTGKSICYQIPALSRYDKTGAMTVVISPLVALMADQVDGLESSGVHSCVAINGLLSSPERSIALERVRLGDASIVLVSPEQLRSSTFQRALELREIGAWVLDEAHCLSGWGHDFRPDYRYIARFINKQSDGSPVPSIVCLTATAKPDVVDDIARHFQDKLDVNLTVFDGGAERSNLVFEVLPAKPEGKLAQIRQLIDTVIPDGTFGGAIVYCATRNASEEVAAYLQSVGFDAGYFHAGMQPEMKKDTQRKFISGDLKVIAATNAFGMGIDKPDVRLVVHADIPGSLENYFQEAGRAGRDGRPARCVLLYSEKDVERQFSISARSRLGRRRRGIQKGLAYRRYSRKDCNLLARGIRTSFARRKPCAGIPVFAARPFLRRSQGEVGTQTDRREAPGTVVGDRRETDPGRCG